MKNYMLILLTFVFASCEYEAQLTYQVKNNTNTTIKVISTNTDSKTSTDTFLISPNERTTIAVNGQGLGRVSKYKEKDENLRSFSKMDISQNDTTKLVTDFLKLDRWIYNETSKHSAAYILTILPTDF